MDSPNHSMQPNRRSALGSDLRRNLVIGLAFHISCQRRSLMSALARFSMSCASSSAALSIREYIRAKPIVPVFEVYRAACISADLCRFQACRNFSSSGLTIRSCEPPASGAGESVTPGAHVGLLVGGRIARFVGSLSRVCFSSREKHEAQQPSPRKRSSAPEPSMPHED